MIYFNLSRYARKHRDVMPDLTRRLDEFKNEYPNMDLEFYCRLVNEHYVSYKGDIMLEFCSEGKRNRFINCRFDELNFDDDIIDTLRIWDTMDYAKCDYCGDIELDYETTTIGDSCYCESCRDEQFFYCDRCHEYHPNDEEREVNTGYNQTETWCEDCVDDYATVCSDCGELWSNDYITEVSGNYLCDDCRDNQCGRCNSCGEWFYNDDLHYDEENDEDLCDYCYERRERENSNGRRRSYHDNPPRKYHYADEETEEGDIHHRLIGTEVETEKGDYDERLRITHEAGQNEHYIYQMRDGSLDDEGIECITQPMSKKFFDQFDFETWMHDLVDAGARSHDAEHCGLHVHLSREWMMTNDRETQLLLIGRMRQFLADNADMVKRFARRSEERWCAYSKTFNSKDEKEGLSKEEIETKLKDSVKDNCDRYQAINNNNSATIEFRIFKGTLNPNTYRASVEFCLRVVDYVRTHSDETLSWDEFVSYKELPESMKTYMQQRHFEF